MQEDLYSRKLTGRWGILFAIIFVASTLRSPLTSVGPVIEQIKSALTLNNSLAGSLTTIPLLIFAVVSPFVSRIAKRLTVPRTVLWAMILLIVALFIRVLGGTSLFIIGTILMGVAIAFGNVLMPSFVKWMFPLQIGLVTGLYTATMNLTAGLGAGFSYPLSQMTHFGYRFALLFWVIFAMIAVILWVTNIKPTRRETQADEASTQQEQATERPAPSFNIMKSKLAWAVALLMGLQSMIFYTIVTWLPTILIARGISPSTSGYLLMLNQFCQVPLTLIFPILAGKINNQRILIYVISLFYLVGFALFFSHVYTLLIIGIILVGAATGACFSMCMALFSFRARTHEGSVTLSGFGQSVGYIIAAVGPFLIGLLHDVTHTWLAAIIAFVLMAIGVLLAGIKAASNDVVEDT
ncbi:CynX/NimT family MFS transporter [Staphylococcus pettenkoferi]|uniref:CynX/NimT family MFS transporter n=1 Tax=Staphylococcus pettenkoferi TaxID=170573 RepID=UPI0002432D97|nr:MFS transporter [Staphylococcus pettenkoferi]ASE37417.1 MFS transporter [Staphylococcus pettenkoferi]EHM68946.1 transporter, major facilitator family protein [Staphylococcus pettenkoferi VCU012]MCY1580855.1 MFS transporter [Staphylococcus pettenkoferi]MCY1619475.1 MFS transporter [Staphylococcus pettenkoferi]